MNGRWFQAIDIDGNNEFSLLVRFRVLLFDRYGANQSVRRVQYLVGVCVADATEKAGIGQSTFQRVIATVQTIREIVELTAQRLQPAGIVFLEAVLAIKQVERRSLFCAGLGYQKGSAGKKRVRRIE